MSKNRIGNQKPRIDQYNTGDIDLAERTIELMRYYGNEPYEWQRSLLRRWMATNEDGTYANPDAGLSVPRQNGKTEILIHRINGGMIFNADTILYTAQSLSTTNEIRRRVLNFFYTAEPELRNMLTNEFDKEPRSLDYIELRNGGRCVFATRTRTGGLGGTNDILIVDEAAEYNDAQQEALEPTTAAGQNQNSQTIMATMPPTTGSTGTVFLRARDRVMSGKAPNFCWQEWGVEKMVDLNDEEAWYASNPSLGLSLMVSSIERASKKMSVDSFNKQHLGWYAGADFQRAISDEQWDELSISEVKLDQDYRKVYAVKFAPDRSSVSLAVGTPLGDKTHIELVERKSMNEGISWLVRWLLERWKTCDKIIIDGAAGAPLLIEELYRSEKRISKKILAPTVKDAGAAYAAFMMAVEQKELTHFNQPLLNVSIRTSKKRDIGKNGMFGFASMNNEVSSDPIEAAAFALYGSQRFCIGTSTSNFKQKVLV